MSVGYLTEEKEWSAMLDSAVTVASLRAGVLAWEPFVDDAQSIADTMDDAALISFRAGLKKERKGKFAGEKFLGRFGALLLPKGLMDASLTAEQYKVPFGLALIRMQAAGAFRPHPSPSEPSA